MGLKPKSTQTVAANKMSLYDRGKWGTADPHSLLVRGRKEEAQVTCHLGFLLGDEIHS